MPFDGVMEKPNPKLKKGEAGLRQIRDELRKPMPPGFQWDYGSYETCAVGLLRYLKWEGADIGAVMLNRLNLSEVEWDRTFGGCPIAHQGCEPVTPADVADSIDAILAQRHPLRRLLSI